VYKCELAGTVKKWLNQHTRRNSENVRKSVQMESSWRTVCGDIDRRTRRS